MIQDVEKINLPRFFLAQRGSECAMVLNSWRRGCPWLDRLPNAVVWYLAGVKNFTMNKHANKVLIIWALVLVIIVGVLFWRLYWPASTNSTKLDERINLSRTPNNDTPRVIAVAESNDSSRDAATGAVSIASKAATLTTAAASGPNPSAQIIEVKDPQKHAQLVKMREIAVTRVRVQQLQLRMQRLMEEIKAAQQKRSWSSEEAKRAEEELSSLRQAWQAAKNDLLRLQQAAGFIAPIT